MTDTCKTVTVPVFGMKETFSARKETFTAVTETFTTEKVSFIAMKEGLNTDHFTGRLFSGQKMALSLSIDANEKG